MEKKILFFISVCLVVVAIIDRGVNAVSSSEEVADPDDERLYINKREAMSTSEEDTEPFDTRLHINKRAVDDMESDRIREKRRIIAGDK